MTENFDWHAVGKSFKGGEADEHFIPIEFIYDVWNAVSEKDIPVGLDLSMALINLRQPERAAEVITRLVEIPSISHDVIIECLAILTSPSL